MADISTYIKAIEAASRGEQVRDAIIKALEAINDQGLGELDPDNEYATKNYINNLLTQGNLFDAVPVQGSHKAVKSGGLYEIIGAVTSNLDQINGESI